ncbi:hypothetical protein BURK2_02345 [Burkholderiales bacterium]|nr:hypothetical protein BURK2_02345 [Burkholderiales bacterium]
MALQIANQAVVSEVERLARATGLSKTAAVERAVDRMLQDTTAAPAKGRVEALLAQLDRVPNRPQAFDPLEWNEHGLPLLYKGGDFALTDIASASASE